MCACTHSKAKRDNYFDVFYWTVLAPGTFFPPKHSHLPSIKLESGPSQMHPLKHITGKKLGIFWNVRDGVKGRIGETSKGML